MDLELLCDREGDVVVPRRAKLEGDEQQQQHGCREQGAEELVLSEVHLEYKQPAPPAASRAAGAGVGSDGGDATVATTAFCNAAGQEVVSIQHALATPLHSVGLQVWRGALLLADYLLSSMEGATGAADAAGAAGTAGSAKHAWQQQEQQHAGGGPAPPGSPLHGITALELGAGSGLAGLVLSAAAHRVFLTDAGGTVLANCQRNAERHLQRHPPPALRRPWEAASDAAGTSLAGPSDAAGSGVAVRQLDWLDPPDWLLPPCTIWGEQQAAGRQAGGEQHQAQGGSLPWGAAAAAASLSPPTSGAAGAAGTGCSEFGWRPEDLQDLQHLDLLLAADPVYEDTLTEGLMRSALLLMQYAARHSGHSPRLLVALERRIVFTLREAAERAPAFDYLRTLFEEDRAEGQQRDRDSRWHVGSEPAPGVATGAAVQGGSAAGSGGSAAAATDASPAPAFPLVGRRLDVGSIPQRLLPYERSPYLELWELRLKEVH
ncbi:hypothetical protein ABPG75_006132 [Micractinium tetrahymenae]